MNNDGRAVRSGSTHAHDVLTGRAANISKLHIGLYHSQQKCGRELAAFLSGHSFLPFMNNMKLGSDVSSRNSHFYFMPAMRLTIYITHCRGKRAEREEKSK
jgi:hypothetical protein